MNKNNVRLEMTSDEEELEQVRNHLYSYNMKSVDADFEPINLVLKAQNNEIVGGLLSYRYGQSIFIEILCVDERLRGSGLGTNLLKKIEEIAAQRAVDTIHLDTFGFQAPGFYLRNGYEQFGELKDVPVKNQNRYFLKKKMNKCR